MEQKETRPRDEDFENVQALSEKKKLKKEESEDGLQEQKVWVIFAIIGVGVLFAIGAVMLFYYMRGHQKTIITNAPESVQEEIEVFTESAESTSAEVIETETSEETEAETSEETPAEETPEAAESVETATEEAAAETPAEFNLEYGGIAYVIKEGKAEMLRCMMADQMAEFGDTVEGYPIVGVRSEAFSGCEHLTHIDLSNSTNFIYDFAFASCPNLAEIVIPDGVYYISPNAFENSPNVTIISHPGTYAYDFALQYGIPWKEGERLTPFNE